MRTFRFAFIFISGKFKFIFKYKMIAERVRGELKESAE